MITCANRPADVTPLSPSRDASNVVSTPLDHEHDFVVPMEALDENVDPVRKSRKTRRGKKRKSGSRQADGHLSSESDSPKKPRQRKRQVMIRPSDVPKAPANFTQFIIDDHENCALYRSFETNIAPDSTASDHETFSLVQDTVGSQESDDEDRYEYLDYGNMVAFYEKDFEAVYSDARVDELLQLSQDQMAAMYSDLEQKATALRDELEKCNPQHRLEDLQRQLLDLQEENRALRLLNRKLRSAAEITTSSSEPSDDRDPCADGFEPQLAQM
ncbi:protein HEXIM1-like [Ornithodoros turicata]